MSAILRATAFVALLFAAGCNLFPPMNWLSGAIADGTYTAPDGEFTVSVPFTDDYEFNYMQAKERPTPDEFYLSFGPAAFNKSIYRLSVYRGRVDAMPAPKLRDLAVQFANELGPRLQTMTGEPLVETGRGNAVVSAGTAYRIRHSQAAPPGTVGTNAAMILHDCWVVHHEGRLFSAWVQTYDRGDGGTRQGEGLSARAFVESVKFGER